MQTLNAQLEQRVRERTTELESTNKELEAFSYTVSHDLRVPLQAIDGYANMLIEDYLDILGAEGQRICVSGTQANNMVTYRLQDNGAGFDMQYVSKLFGVFQRLHSDTEFPGLGVGLAIAHRIIQRHGGRIWAECSEGYGTIFSFPLPIQGATDGRP